MREASLLRRLVLCEVELSFQNGRITHARDAIDDFVPADMKFDNAGVGVVIDRLTDLIAEAEKSGLFGVLRVVAAVRGDDVLGFRCRRERTTKKG